MTRHSTIITLSTFGPLSILAAMLLFSASANAPSNTPASSAKIAAPPKPIVNLTPTSISNAYASFDYPAALTQASVGKLTSGEAAAYTFLYHSTAVWSLTILIVNIPSGLVSSNNAYQLREANPQMYEESQLTINNQPIIVMTNKTYSGFSKIAFLVDGQYQAMISLSSNGSVGFNNLNKTFSMILNSWQWNNGY